MPVYLCGMFQIGKTIVSEELIAKDFVCNLTACKGGCCVEGDAGAPLEEEELPILEAVLEQVKPYLRKEGIREIEEQGAYIKGIDGEWETPLVDGKECAYVTFDAKGTALCAIEQAYRDGVISWKKPVSCHLYPVRVKAYSAFAAVNYHQWQLCDPACSLGAELQVPVYQFVKEALIRKFGEKWYAELEEVARNLKA